MNGVSLQGLAVVLGGGAAQGAGASEVHRDREQQNKHRPDRPAEIQTVVMHDAPYGLGTDEAAGGHHEHDLDDGGKVLHLAVAIVVLLVGGPIGYTDAPQRDRCGDEIDAGVRGFAEHAKGTGEQPGDQLEQRDAARGHDRGQGGGALGRAALLHVGAGDGAHRLRIHGRCPCSTLTTGHTLVA